MQEAFCYFIGIMVAGWVTLLVAFPDHLIPELGGKKKKFSGRHWGAYQDSKKVTPEEEAQEEGIEVGVPAKRIRHVVGSQTYAGGRGVSMRG